MYKRGQLKVFWKALRTNKYNNGAEYAIVVDNNIQHTGMKCNR